MGYERRAMPHVIYSGIHLLCPWPGCSQRIEGIDFQLEQWQDPSRYAQYVKEWWQGRGLVGRCPGCGNHVLFSVTGKESIADPVAQGLAVLPDDWHQTAHIIS